MATVLLIRSSLYLGGIERQLLDHALRLHREGWGVRLLALHRGVGEHPLSTAARARGLTAETVPDPAPFSLSPWRRLRGIIAGTEPALIHTCDYRSDLFARFAAGSIPWLAEAHGYTGEGLSMALWNRLDAWALRRAQAVVAVSTAGETQLAAAGVPPRRLHVIGNGRAILPASPLPPPAALPPPGPHLLFAGRRSPEKGLDLLLRAWPALRQAHAAAQLWVLGPPAAGAAYRRTLAPLLAQAGVHTPGYVPDVRPWLRAVHGVATPSRRETWGMTVFEALCLGAPVAAARVGGLPGLCRGAAHAHLVSPESPQALAKGLLAVLAADFPRGDGPGRAFCAQSRFDPALRHQRLLDLYRSLI